jgi:hypothetical protein
MNKAPQEVNQAQYQIVSPSGKAFLNTWDSLASAVEACERISRFGEFFTVWSNGVRLY